MTLYTLMLKIATLVVALFCSSALANLPMAVQTYIAESSLTPEQISLWIAPADGSAPIIDYHSQTPRTPASVMKVITTGTGLLLLGADYRWKTEFYIDGKLTNGILDGNLIIKGYGDPYMVQEDMANMVSALQISGLSQIRGNVILDSSYYANAYANPNFFDGHGTEPYNAIPHALSINFRTIDLFFSAGKNQIKIRTNPKLSRTRIQNHMTLSRSKRCRGEGFAPEIWPDYSHNVIIVSGSMSRHCRQKRLNKVLADAGDLYFAHFKKAWQKKGGTITGAWSYGGIPKQSKLFYTARSRRPLSEQIAAMNKISNNIMTRQLFLTIGAEKMRPPANLAKSRAVVLQQLKQLGLDTRQLFIDNGSGLSRTASISARQLGQFLLAMQATDARYTFENSLSVAGVDGTLRYRLKNTPLAGNVIGKSGTLKQVKSLAGYVYSQSGKKYVYVMLLAGENARSGGQLMDNILQWIYEQ